MSGWLPLLSSLAGAWSEAMWRASWQGGLALALVWAACRVTPRLPASVHCWLWRAAYLKVLIALFWATPIDLPILPPHPVLSSAPSGLVDQPTGGLLARNIPHTGVFPAAAPPGLSAAPGAPATAEPQRPPARLSWPLGLLLAWLLGAGWHFGRLVQQWRRIAQLRRGCEICSSAPAFQLVEELCRRLRLGLQPELLVSEVPGPLVVGALRPAIVLPADLDVTPAEREWILAHELAHVKRRDLWWAHLPVLTRVLFFFHPVVWLGHREWRLAQEMACDALTVRVTSARACDYGELLVRLASRRPETPEVGLTAIGILEPGTPLERRLSVLRSISTPGRTQALCGGVLLAFALGGLVPWQVSAQESASRPPSRSNRKLQPASPVASPAPAGTQRTLPAVAPPPAAVAGGAKLSAVPRPPVATAARLSEARAAKRRTAAKPAAQSVQPAAKTEARRSVTPPAAVAAPPVPAPVGPAITDPGILQAAGISVGPYGGLIAALTPEELHQYVVTELRATMQLLESTRARVQNGTVPSSELVPLETKAAQLEILVRAAQRLAQAPPARKRPELYAALSPEELLQFLRTELRGAQTLLDLKQAQFRAGVAPGTELLPLETRTQQLEILVRAAQRRVDAPR